MESFKRQKGITLVALVVTIIVLIILAGIAVSMTIGENGIFTRAKEAKRLQITAEAKEKIGTEILDAQVEAVQKNETLQQSKVEEIISKYGELQADGDTIKLKDNGYEISLKEIYNGATSSSGGSTDGSTGSAELDSLKAELAQTNATEDKILKDYKAYSNGKLMTGTMENYAGQTVTSSTITENGENVEITIPQAGYYGTDSKVSVPVDKISSNLNLTINGTITNISELSYKVQMNQKPKYIMLTRIESDSLIFIIYDATVSTTEVKQYYRNYANTKTKTEIDSIGETSAGLIQSIDNDGFTINQYGFYNNATVYYFAK